MAKEVESLSIMKDRMDALVNSFVEGTGLDKEAVRIALCAHAEKWGGCMNCVFGWFSKERADYAAKGNLRGFNPWYMRKCALGLNQDDCDARQPIPRDKGE